jgi:TetR/AcrR family transcriptional regulator, regulator of cefoperazone and chloramphenicol sensitivity
VAGASVRDIAEAAGVTAGLITHCFGSKDGLKAEIDELMVQVFTAPLAAPLEGTPERRLKKISEALAQTMTAHPELRAYLRRSFLENDPASSKVFNRFATLLRDLQYEMRGAGLLRDDIDLDWTPFQVLFLHFGPLLLGPAIEQIMGVEAYADDVVRRRSQATQDLLSHGIFRDPTTMQRGQT